jgi:hypothetical protein
LCALGLHHPLDWIGSLVGYSCINVVAGLPPSHSSRVRDRAGNRPGAPSRRWGRAEGYSAPRTWAALLGSVTLRSAIFLKATASVKLQRGGERGAANQVGVVCPREGGWVVGPERGGVCFGPGVQAALRGDRWPDGSRWAALSLQLVCHGRQEEGEAHTRHHGSGCGVMLCAARPRRCGGLPPVAPGGPSGSWKPAAGAWGPQRAGWGWEGAINMLTSGGRERHEREEGDGSTHGGSGGGGGLGRKVIR